MTKKKTQSKKSIVNVETKAIEVNSLPWVELGDTVFPVVRKNYHIEISMPMLLFDKKHGICLGEFVTNTVTKNTTIHSITGVFLNDVTHYIVFTKPDYKPVSTTQI